MLSKIHSQSTQNIRLPSPRRPSIDKSPASQHDSATGSPHPKEDTFKVSQSPYLLEGINDNSYFSGTSSVKHFLGMWEPSERPEQRFTDTTSRRIQAESGGIRSFYFRRQRGHITSEYETQYSGSIASLRSLESTAKTRFGSDGQHLLPRMGTVVPRPPSTYVPFHLREICRESGVCDR